MKTKKKNIYDINKQAKTMKNKIYMLLVFTC